MKDQYIGDVNDFFKYSILEIFEKEFKKKIMVVWMLTKSEGMDINYDELEQYNKNLFYKLQHIIKTNKRNIKSIQEIYPNYVYKTDFFQKRKRKKYFDEVKEESKDCNFIFFDPDNGISFNDNNKNIKHLYWSEIKEFWKSGKDLLIYQHFRRQRWNDYLLELIDHIKEDIKDGFLIPIKTRNVMFVYISRENVFEKLKNIFNCWDNQIEVLDLKGMESTQITTDNNKIFYYFINTHSDTTGYSMYTVPIISPIQSPLKIITRKIVNEIYLMSNDYKQLEQCNLVKDDLVGKYFDRDGYIYYPINAQIYKFNIKLKYFEKLYRTDRIGRITYKHPHAG